MAEQRIGWVGAGRMGFALAERLLKAGVKLSIYNRTRAKAEPLAAKGGKIVDKLSDLAYCDAVFSIVSEGKDLEQVYFGKDGERVVILVGGGTKQRQERDIRSALARWQGYKRRKR